MATIDEVKNLQQQGKADLEIVSELRKLGVPEQEVLDAISQSKIKDAVSSNGNLSGQRNNSGEKEIPPFPDSPPGQQNLAAGQTSQQAPQTLGPEQGGGQQTVGNPAKPSTMEYSAPSPQQGQSQAGQTAQQSGTGYGASQEYSGMQPSMLSSGAGGQTGGQQEYSSGSYPDQQQVGGEAYQDTYGGYPQYQPYQDSYSSDMITEISEQVVSERLGTLQGKMEKVIDLKTVMEARVTNLNERLQRIEKIIDRLQLSLLQKVGEYVTDVKDVKRELEETQKTFASVAKKKHAHHATHSEHKTTHKKAVKKKKH